MADLIETAGATHVMTMTLHSPQVHGFFRIPIDPLTARGEFIHHLGNRGYLATDTVVVAPDAGGAKSAARFGELLRLPVAVATKTRVSDTQVQIDPLVGRQVQGFRRAIVYDDEIATGGSVAELCGVLMDNGIQDIVVACTHGLFMGAAIDRLGHIPCISEIVTTDTVQVPTSKRLPNMTVLTVAEVFADAIARNYRHESLGSLFSAGEG